MQKLGLDLFDKYYLPHSSKVHIAKLEKIDIKKRLASYYKFYLTIIRYFVLFDFIVRDLVRFWLFKSICGACN